MPSAAMEPLPVLADTFALTLATRMRPEPVLASTGPSTPVISWLPDPVRDRTTVFGGTTIS